MARIRKVLLWACVVIGLPALVISGISFARGVAGTWQWSGKNCAFFAGSGGARIWCSVDDQHTDGPTNLSVGLPVFNAYPQAFLPTDGLTGFLPSNEVHWKGIKGFEFLSYDFVTYIWRSKTPEVYAKGKAFYLIFPLWLLVPLCIWPARRFQIWYRRRRRANQGLCLNCGYNLTGNTSGRCPECGQSTTGSHLGGRSFYLLQVKTSGFSRSVRLKAKPYTKAVRQDGFSN